MKISAPVNINITLLKSDINPSVRIQDIKNFLIDAGANVAGYKENNNDLIMVVSGDIDYEDIEEAFEVIADVDVNEYIVDDDIDYANEIDLFEKKRSCCPKKRTAPISRSTMNEKKQIQRKPAARRVNESKKRPAAKKNSGNLVNLYEALHGNYRKPNNKNVTLNDVIDNMTGKRLSESVARRAMLKAKQSYIKNKLGPKTYKLVCESLKAGKKSIYPDVKINNKAIVEYTTNELEVLLEKLTNQIAKIQKEIAGLNEADGVKKLHEQLDKKNKIRKILDEEISYRKALALREDDEHKDDEADDKFDFKSLNPSDFQTDDNEEENKDKDSEEKPEEGDDDKSSDENPDEDTVEELGSIVITLASKEDAEDLKSDCIEAGIPEDVIEISPVEDEESEEDNEEETSDKEEEGEEEQEKKTEESFGRKYKNRLYEEDDEEETSDEDEEQSDDSSEEDADGSYKLTLTDTDELPKFKEVLIDKWGVTEDEFTQNIGEIVEDGDESNEDDGDGDGEKSSDDENPDDFDFDPDEIFKDL